MKVTVYSDYVCPFCYLGEQSLENALKEINEDVEVEWKPFQLRPEGTEPLSPKSSYIQQGWNFGVKPLAQKLGVEMVLPSMDPHPSTLLAHRGFLFAQSKSKGDEYAKAVLTAFWKYEKNIGDVNVLTDIANEIGLPTNEFVEAINQTTNDSAIQNPSFINAVPTFIIGDTVLQGAQSKEAFLNALKKQSTPGSGDFCGIEGC